MVTKIGSSSMIYAATKKVATKKKVSGSKKVTAKKTITKNLLTKKTTAKSSVKKSKSRTKVTQSQGWLSGVTNNLDGRQEMISVAAYFLAEKRNFLNGDEREDWIQAERDIDKLLGTHAPLT